MATSEDIVRRAAAAFNAGRRDEARKLCEEGLVPSPGEPMISHLLAAVLATAGELDAAAEIELVAGGNVDVDERVEELVPAPSAESWRPVRPRARWLEGGIHFGLGSTLAMSRAALEKAGGLEPLG